MFNHIRMVVLATNAAGSPDPFLTKGLMCLRNHA